MASAHDTNKRKRSSERSNDADSDNDDNDSIHLTPDTSTYGVLPDLLSTTATGNYNLRPRRPNSNYDTHFVKGEPRRRAKRRQIEPLATIAPANCLSQVPLVPDVSAEAPEVQRLLRGQTRIEDFHVQEPGNNYSSLANLTRHLRLTRFENRLVENVIHVKTLAVDMIQHWRQSGNGNNNVTTIVVENPSAESTSKIAHHHQGEDDSGLFRANASPLRQMTLSRGGGEEESRSTAEPLSSSYVDCTTTGESEEDYDELSNETSETSENGSTGSCLNNKREQWAAPREASPPPLHGYPRANETYEENILPSIVVQRDISAFVWNRRYKRTTGMVLLDSGADANFVSYDYCTKLGHGPLPLEMNKMRTFETLAGTEQLADTYVNMDLAIDSVGLKRHQVGFLVVDTNQIDMVLGHKYIGQHQIWEKLVAKKSSVGSRACAIFSKKPSPEQIETMQKEKKLREQKSNIAEANIRADGAAKRAMKEEPIRTMSTSSTESAMSVKTAVNINASFGASIGRTQNSSSLNRSVASLTESAGTSGSSSFRNSFDSRDSARFWLSPATTFSSQSTAGSSIDATSTPYLRDSNENISKGKGKHESSRGRGARG